MAVPLPPKLFPAANGRTPAPYRPAPLKPMAAVSTGSARRVPLPFRPSPLAQPRAQLGSAPPVYRPGAAAAPFNAMPRAAAASLQQSPGASAPRTVQPMLSSAVPNRPAPPVYRLSPAFRSAIVQRNPESSLNTHPVPDSFRVNTMLEKLNTKPDGREEVQYVAVYKADGKLLKCYFGANDEHASVKSELEAMVEREQAVLDSHANRFGWDQRNLPIKAVPKPAGSKMHAEQAALQALMDDLSTKAVDAALIKRIVVRGKKVPCDSCDPVLRRFKTAMSVANPDVEVVVATAIDTETPQKKHVAGVQIASPNQVGDESPFYTRLRQEWGRA